jgi:hypothetical protein
MNFPSIGAAQLRCPADPCRVRLHPVIGSCLANVQLMSRSGTDSPYRPTPNRRLSANPQPSKAASVPHRRSMTRQPVLRQEKSISARLSVCRNLARLLLHRPIRPRRHPMVAPPAGPAAVQATALPQQVGGWLNSLGSDRSGPHHCSRGRSYRAGPSLIIWRRTILEPLFKCRKSRDCRHGAAVQLDPSSTAPTNSCRRHGQPRREQKCAAR